MTTRQQAAARRASDECARLYVELNSTDLPVAEVAERVGVAERTFYRYFPRKRDTIRPLLESMTEKIAASIRNSGDLPLEQVLVLAFTQAFGEDREEQTRRLFPLIFRDSELYAALLQVVHEGEPLLRPAIAERLNVSADSVQARAAAALFVSAILTALDAMVNAGSDPFTTFSSFISAASDNPLRPR